MKINYILSDNAVPTFLEAAIKKIENDGMDKFIQEFSKGTYDELLLEEHYTIEEINLQLKKGGVLEKLLVLNDKEYKDLNPKVLGGLQSLQRDIGKELYELLKPLRDQPEYQPHLFNENFWDYLSLVVFRNYLVARWIKDASSFSLSNFKKRMINSPKGIHPPMSDRSRHGLFRLYKAHELTLSLNKEEQEALLNNEQAMQSHLERKLFFTSPKLTSASIKRVVKSRFDTNKVKAFTKLQLAVESSEFLWDLEVDQIIEKFESTLSDAVIASQV